MSDTFEAPAEKRRTKKAAVPPAGRHQATIAKIEKLEGGHVRVGWKFTARGRRWSLDQEVDGAEFGDILVDVGLAGRSVGPDDIVGSKATLITRTTGGETGARVKEVLPPDS